MMNPPRAHEKRSARYESAIEALGKAAEEAELKRLRVLYAEELLAGIQQHEAQNSRLPTGRLIDARERFARRGARSGRKGS